MIYIYYKDLIKFELLPNLNLKHPKKKEKKKRKKGNPRPQISYQIIHWELKEKSILRVILNVTKITSQFSRQSLHFQEISAPYKYYTTH